jgi:ribosomal-protein-alanine N-acetyltransferase
MQYTGKKVTLVPLSETYREVIFQATTPNVVKFMTWNAPEDISGTDAFIKKAMESIEKGEQYGFVIVDIDSQEFVGWCNAFKRDVTEDKYEIGIWLKESMWGKGYAKDALQTFFTFLRNETSITQIHYRVQVENIASQRVCESLGGVRVGMVTLQHQVTKKDLPSIQYLITL